MKNATDFTRPKAGILRNGKSGTFKRLTRVIASILVFATTYALILPAITLEATAYCGQEAHEHTEACYVLEYTCGLEEHAHTEACVQVTRNLICTAEEHTHDDACRDEEGNLICSQEEHAHGDSCYEETSVTVCGLKEHTHSDACMKRTLTCGKEEHKHTDQCYADLYADTDDSKWIARIDIKDAETASEILLAT